MILTILLPALEKIVNAALKNDPDALTKIASIKNQVIKIHCEDWKMTFYIVPSENGLQLHQKYFRADNTAITGTLNNFLNLFLKGADTKNLFHYPVEITGNTHNIEVLRDTFQSIDIDWEEKLSHYLGDVLAHKICTKIKKARNAIENSGEKLTEQAAEYIHYEAKNLVSKKQAEQFYKDVAKLRNDVERLESRLMHDT